MVEMNDERTIRCRSELMCVLKTVFIVLIGVFIFHLFVDMDNPVSLAVRAFYTDGSPTSRGGKTNAPFLALTLPAFAAGLIYARLRKPTSSLPIRRIVLASLGTSAPLYATHFALPHFVHFDMWWIRRVPWWEYVVGFAFNWMVMTVAFLIGVRAIENSLRKSAESDA